MLNPRHQGILMVLVGSGLWGISGCAGQYLLQQCALSPEYLVVTRLILAGLILLCFAYAQNQHSLFAVFNRSQDRRALFVFALAGMLAVQYTYFASIAYGNAAATTVIQYLMPVFILGYSSLMLRRLPKRREILCVALAFVGTVLIVTHLDFTTFAIPPRSVWLALASAVAAAFYTVYPKPLLLRFSSALIIGWSMLIGGLCLSLLCPPWPPEGNWDLKALLMYGYIVIFGTVIPFALYIGSTKYIPATETSVLASFEPLCAIVFSTLFLATPFGLWDLGGAALIILAVTLLTRRY